MASKNSNHGTNNLHVWLTGTITAVTPLTCALPQAKPSPGKPFKLPRIGNSKDARTFYPASGFLGRLRRSGMDDFRGHVLRVKGKEYMEIGSYFLNRVGGINGFSKNPGGLHPGADAAARAANPFLSVFGSAGMAGKLGVGALIAVKPLTDPPVAHGVRTVDPRRDPTELEVLSPSDIDLLNDRLANDAATSIKKGKLKKEIKKLKAAAHAETDKAIQADLYAQINAMEEANKEQRAGAVPIANPFGGFEYFPSDTVFTHRMSLINATPAELAMFFAALRAFAAMPRLGGHWHQMDCGWIEARWDITVREAGSYGACHSAGFIEVSPQGGFVCESDVVSAGLALYDGMAKTGFPEFDFGDHHHLGDPRGGRGEKDEKDAEGNTEGEDQTEPEEA